MRRWIPAFAAALLLTACDAGDRNDPGSDNKWPGPEIAVQLPGPSTTIRFAVTEADFKAGNTPQIQAMLHLRALGEIDEVSVRWALDGGPFRTLEDPSKPFALPKGLAPGTHLLTAYVAKKKGDYEFGRRSATATTFHVTYDVTRKVDDEETVETLGGETNTYGHRVDGQYQRFNRNAPQLVVHRDEATVHVFVVNARLDPERVRVNYLDGILDGETTKDGEHDMPYGGTFSVQDAATSVRMTLERMNDDGEWERVPGALTAWPVVAKP